MRWLQRLFNIGTAKFPGLKPGRGWVVNVVGESQYQQHLARLKGDYEHDLKVEAVLVPEPGNRFDGNAVRIDIAGSPVGYLPRDIASQTKLNGAGTCSAKIVGGFILDDGLRAHYGVKLNLSLPPRFEK